MPKVRRTISRDSVFRDMNNQDTRANLQVPTQGLLQEETRTRQTAVWLGDQEIEWLDNQCRTIQRGGWRGVTRSALIRALIRAASEQQAELSGVSGEVEISERFASRKQ